MASFACSASRPNPPPPNLIFLPSNYTDQSIYEDPEIKMETSTMTPTTKTAQTRTASLPVINKSFLPAHQDAAQTNDVAQMVDDILNGMIFGPYLVSLSRRVE